MNKALTFALLVPVAVVARAEVFLSPEQATFQIFPGQKFAARTFALSDEQKRRIEELSGQTVRSTQLQTLAAPSGDLVFLDEVLGKHEQIRLAVGIGRDGKVHGIEILEYRETYGYQVRNADWRKQFVGKNSSDELKLGADIQNISGATLSSAHVTGGIKRLLVTHDVLFTHSAR